MWSNGLSMGLETRNRFLILALPLTHCVMLGNSRPRPVPQFPHVPKRDDTDPSVPPRDEEGYLVNVCKEKRGDKTNLTQ